MTRTILSIAVLMLAGVFSVGCGDPSPDGAEPSISPEPRPAVPVLSGYEDPIVSMIQVGNEEITQAQYAPKSSKDGALVVINLSLRRPEVPVLFDQTKRIASTSVGITDRPDGAGAYFALDDVQYQIQMSSVNESLLPAEIEERILAIATEIIAARD